MKSLLLILIFPFAAFVIIILSQLPVVTGFGAKEVSLEIQRLEPIELVGKTLLVSDFQLEGPQVLTQFDIDADDVEHIVIVGDFFFSPRGFLEFGKTEEERLQKALGTFIPSDFTGNIFLVWGKTHDPVLSKSEYTLGEIKLRYLGEYGKFTINGTPAFAFHGHQLYGGAIGGGLSWLSKSFGYPLPFERLARKRFGIDEDTWLVTGHSHVPAIDYENKIANTGSFAGVPFNFFFQIHVGTGILVDGEKVTLLEF